MENITFILWIIVGITAIIDLIVIASFTLDFWEDMKKWRK